MSELPECIPISEDGYFGPHPISQHLHQPSSIDAVYTSGDRELKIAAGQPTFAEAIIPAVRCLKENPDVADVQFQASNPGNELGEYTLILGVLERSEDATQHPYSLFVDPSALSNVTRSKPITEPASEPPASFRKASQPTTENEPKSDGCGCWWWIVALFILWVLAIVNCEGGSSGPPDITPFDSLPF